jgi:hypothetical protein
MSDASASSNEQPLGPSTNPLELVSRAVKDGAADARDAAAKTWAASSLFVSRFVYTTCYTISYGVVFPTTLLARAIPRDNAAVQGLIDGAVAAKAKAEQIRVPSLALPVAIPVPEMPPA